MSKNKDVSAKSHEEALLIAKGTQKPGQSKEQTKLIAAGIEKGIAQYKKQHKAKLREQDKQRKKRDKSAAKQHNEPLVIEPEISAKPPLLPWVLLGASWLGFIGYLLLHGGQT